MIHVFGTEAFFYFFTAPASRVREVPSPYEYYYYYLWIIHIIIIINGVCTPPSVIHGYGSKADQPWINVDQRGSSVFSLSLQHVAAAFSLQPAAAVLTHGSCVMRHASWLIRHALSPFSVQRVQRQASGVRRQAHGSCVPLTWHASCVRLMAHASGVRRQALDSWLMRQASHASGVESVRRHAFTSLIQPHSAAARCRS